MKHKSNEGSICPIARSLDVVGEWWSLLIIRDAMLGVRRFSEFERSLGMAKNMLTMRLKKLVEQEILRMVPASDGSSYREYELTKKGEDLFPVLVALRQWGDRYMFREGEEHPLLQDSRAHRPVDEIVVRSADGRVLGITDVELSSTDSGKGEQRHRYRAR